MSNHIHLTLWISAKMEKIYFSLTDSERCKLKTQLPNRLQRPLSRSTMIKEQSHDSFGKQDSFGEFG